MPTSDKYVYRESDSELDTDKLLKAGFITDGDPQLVSEEFQEDINQKLKYRQSVYYKNEIIQDILVENENISGNFEILEPGYYKIEMTASGTRSAQSINFLTNFVDQNGKFTKQTIWKNTITNESLKFTQDYKWFLFEDNNQIEFGYFKITNQSLILFKGEKNYFDEDLKYQLDDDNSLAFYATLFFEYSDRYNPFFRKIILFENNSSFYKEFILDLDNLIDNVNQNLEKKEGYYSESSKIVNYGDIINTFNKDFTKLNEKISNNLNFPYWNYTYDLNLLKIENNPVGGNSGRIFDIIFLSEDFYKVHYYIAKAQDSQTIGSFLLIFNKSENLIYSCFIQSGKFFNLSNISDSEFVVPYIGNDLLGKNFLLLNKNSETYIDQNEKIGIKKIISSDGEIYIKDKILNKFNGKGLGSEAQGIKQDFNNFNFYSEAEKGFLKFSFLSPSYSTVVNLSLKYQDSDDLIGISGIQDMNIPIDTFIEYRFNLKENKQIDLLKSTINLKPLNEVLNNNIFKEKFSYKRISNSIEVLRFYLFEDTKINIQFTNRQYNLFFIKNKKILSQTEVESIIFNDSIGLNRSLFYLIDQNFYNSNPLIMSRIENSDKVSGKLIADYYFLYKECTLFFNIINFGHFINLEKILLNDNDENSYYYYENNVANLQNLYSNNYLDIKNNLEKETGSFILNENKISFAKNKFYIPTIYNFYLTPGQLFYIVAKFDTFKTKISQINSVFNSSYFLCREGINIFNGTFDYSSFCNQSIILIINSSLNYILNLEKRLYKISISQENQENLNWFLRKDTFYPFENVTINFVFSSFFKFDFTKSFAFINFDNNINKQNLYNIIDFFNSEIYYLNNSDETSINIDTSPDTLNPDINLQKQYYKMFQILYKYNFIYERLIQDKSKKLTHGYFRNLPESVKQLLSQEEKLELNFLMKMSNVDLEFDVAYTDLSTIIEMGEREFKNIKINQDGYYRIFLAGGCSGNGGDGGDAGISMVKPEDIESGRDDVYSSTVMASSSEIYKDGIYFEIKITVSKSIMPVLYELNELDLGRIINSESTKDDIAIKIFKNIARPDELIFSFLNAMIDGVTPVKNNLVNSVTEQNLEYDPKNCLIYIKKIRFIEDISSKDSFKLENFNLVLIESYMNTKSTVQNSNKGTTSIAKNTYTFYPPRNFKFYSSQTGAEVIDSDTKEFIRQWNKYWFNIDSDQNINVFDKDITNFDSQDWRAQRIHYGATSNNYEYYFSDQNGSPTPWNWPDIFTSPKISFPNTNQALKLNTRLTIESTNLGGGHFGGTTITQVTSIVPKLPPSLPSSTRPANLVPPFLLPPNTNSINFTFGSSGTGGNSFGASNYSSYAGGNGSGGFLLRGNAGRQPPANVYTNSDYNNEIFEYFCYSPKLQARCCRIQIRSYKTTEMQGTREITVTRYRYEINRHGLIMICDFGVPYFKLINGSNPRYWNMKIKSCTYRKVSFGTKTNYFTSEVVDVIVKYGNGGGAGRGGDGFLKKSLSGTPGTASAIGSWSDYDFTAKQKSTQAAVGKLGDLVKNEINGMQGLLGIEAFCFGIENSELRENPVTAQIINHETLDQKIFQTQDKTLCFRGALIDNIFYLTKGNLIVETGGKGGDGENAFNAGLGEFGYSGGGGGAGAPSILYIYSNFYIYNSYYAKLGISDRNTFISMYEQTDELKHLINQSENTFVNNILFLASGGRAGDMFITRNPYIFYTIANYSVIDETFLNPPTEKISNLFGSSSSSSSSEVIMNEYYKFTNEYVKQLMGWEFNGLPGGNGGSGYIGGNGGNGGNGITGIPNTTTKGSPVLQKNIFVSLGDNTNKIINNFIDLFGSSSSSSHTINIYDNYHYYPYTEHNENNLTSGAKIQAVLSSYIGRSRLIPLSKNDTDSKQTESLRNLYLHSFFLYDPSLFFYKIPNPQRALEEPGRNIVLRGSAISSFNYYKILKNHLQKQETIFYSYDYKQLDKTTHKMLQVPGFGGGYNTFFYKDKNSNEPKLYATFNLIDLPKLHLKAGEIMWEKLPAGGKPAEISENTLNFLKNTDFKKILLYDEQCKTNMSLKTSQNLKNYNLRIKDKVIPLEGAGCKIIYLCATKDSKNLDTGKQVLDIY
ncbi:MAG: hypothetical protein LBC61_06755 [Candidatus Peribacteria bacterium]|nr:hypothetical protein [Candidatus Peribacteria bacterium]